MSVLVTYATRHGATGGIAERIADTLRDRGLTVEVRPMNEVTKADLSTYQAFVIGSAVYFGSWMNGVTRFVERHQAVLAQRPVWLFSSGPLGVDLTDAQGRDLRDKGVPQELERVTRLVHPRDHRVFFGALDHRTFDVCEHMMWSMPGSRKLLIEGDFRNWSEVESWAAGIAQQLEPRRACHEAAVAP